MAAPEQVDVWVGRDAGQKEHPADVLDDGGERLFARAVASSQADLETLLDRAARHGTPGLVTGQPGSIAQLALAVAARRGPPVAYVPGLVMRRAADATRLANRLRDALTSIAPALERAVGERLGQPGIGDLLARYPTLTALRAASQSRIERTIKARSPRIAAKVTTTIAAVLAAQDITVPAEAATGRVISELATDLDRVTGRRDDLAREIEQAFLSCPSAELLASMPGIGPQAGARILAEAGDGSAFTTGSKLAAYAGLAPVTRQSGTSLAAETRSRRGNHRLKNAMFLASFASLRDPASKTSCDRKRAEGKRRNAALICLARRRCDVILAMLRTRQPYRAGQSRAADLIAA